MSLRKDSGRIPKTLRPADHLPTDPSSSGLQPCAFYRLLKKSKRKFLNNSYDPSRMENGGVSKSVALGVIHLIPEGVSFELPQPILKRSSKEALEEVEQFSAR